ncbi:MAG: alpha/beta fold hydrolase [Actinophytocola sp.]|nr:alpha/beta fold hydrolase [Actinophytocola sp.]
MTHLPSMKILPATGETKAVVLVLHGGAENGTGRIRRWSRPYLRMLPFARALRDAGKQHGIEVCLLRNRVRGWNKPDLDPVQDGRWALRRLAEGHPGLPIVLIGHSMGGRVALRVADDPRVVGVCALAPWTTDKDWVSPVEGVNVLIAHGTEDQITTPESSFEYAKRASEVTTVLRFELADEAHAMLRRPKTWTRLVRAFALESLGITQYEPLLASAAQLPSGDRIRLRV